MRLDDRFYESRRAAKQRERMQQKHAEEAAAQSEVLRRIQHEETEQKAREKLLFCVWYLLDKRLQELQADLVRNAEDIPHIKNTCNDVWFAYLNIDRPEFYNYI